MRFRATKKRAFSSTPLLAAITALSSRKGEKEDGAAGRIRTHDPLVRSQILYPTELQPREEETIGVRQGKSKGGFLKIPHMRYEPGVKRT